MIRCNIQCRFGFERDLHGCKICRCFEPCQVNKAKTIDKLIELFYLSDKNVRRVMYVLLFLNKANVYKYHALYLELNVNHVNK